MLNPLFDGFARQLERVVLPLEVTCHQVGDDPRFAENPSFNRTLQGFGWSDPSFAYTWGRHFLAPTGLDAILLDHWARTTAEEELDPCIRGTSLLVFALGRLVERVEGAQWMTRDSGSHSILGWDATSPRGEPPKQIPPGTGDFDLCWSRIDGEGNICIRRLDYRDGQLVSAESSCDILRKVPRYTLLKHFSMTEGSFVYSFTDAEIAQLEVAIAEYRGIGELLLPVIVDAARVKFGELTGGAWRMIAGTPGISEESARRSFQDHETWWEGYARIHDGGNPDA